MGILLLVVGLAVLGFGVMNHLEGKRIVAAPLAPKPAKKQPAGVAAVKQGPAPAPTLSRTNKNLAD